LTVTQQGGDVVERLGAARWYVEDTSAT